MKVLVLTSERVIYIRHNPVMGGWSSDWEYEYSKYILLLTCFLTFFFCAFYHFIFF